MSGVATPEIAPREEDDEHRHLTVSSKSVADYFKEKMQLAAPKPSDSGMEIDEAPRGGIGSRLESWGRDEIEEGEGLHAGLGMDLLAKMSATRATAETLAQQETPGESRKKKAERREKKHRNEDGGGEVNRKPKKKVKNRAPAAND